MTESNRKAAPRKTRRASRRGGGSQAKHDEEATEQAQAQAQKVQASSKAKESPTSKDDNKVSSLLETGGNEVKQLLEAADQAAKKIREAAQTGSVGPDEPADRGEPVTLISRTNHEVQRVLEAAADAADKIREEARLEARQLLEDTKRQAESVTTDQMERISDLTEQVLGELGSVQAQLDSLRAAYDRAIQKMGTELGIERTDVWDARNGGGDEDEDEGDSAELRRRLGRRRKAPHGTPDGISEGARLLALQQLMAGVDAEVIEQRLSKEFGIKDPKPLLDWMGVRSEKPQKPKKR